jgi:hypothetical protein
VFKVGDKIFMGEIDRDTIRGRIHVRYLDPSIPPSCIKKFDTWWSPFELNLSENTVLIGQGQEDHRLTLRGRYMDERGVANPVGQICPEPFWEENEIALTRHTQVTKPLAKTPGVPTRIAIWFYPPSTVVGQSISIDIHLANGDGSNAAADRDFNILLDSSQGSLEPRTVKIQTGNTRAGAWLRTAKPGDIRVTARNEQGLTGESGVATACSDKDVKRIFLDADRQRAFAADSSPIPFRIKFVDADGQPSSGKILKALVFSHEGVGRRQSLDLAAQDPYSVDNIPKDQCISLQQIVSDAPGSATVIAKFGALSTSQMRFWFFTPINWILVLTVILGGCCGVFVKIAFARGRRPGLRGVARKMMAGMITCVVLFMFDYYVGSDYVPALTSGLGIAFGTGATGGFAGPLVFQLILTASSKLQGAGTSRTASRDG